MILLYSTMPHFMFVETSCKKDSNPCAHTCHHTPLGPRCSCNSGYVLAGDGHSCRDQDECHETRGGSPCSQLCRNTAGSYICSCAKGYMLRADGRSCKAKGIAKSSKVTRT